jgi:hypothetical protein
MDYRAPYSCRWADSEHPRSREGFPAAAAAAVAAVHCPWAREVRRRVRDRSRRAEPAGGIHPSVAAGGQDDRWRVPGRQRAGAAGSWCRCSRVVGRVGAANVGWDRGVEESLRELRGLAPHIGPTCRAEAGRAGGEEAEEEEQLCMRLVVLGLRIEAAQAGDGRWRVGEQEGKEVLVRVQDRA